MSIIKYQKGSKLPEDYNLFLEYSKTAPENRRPEPGWSYGDPEKYDHYGMWEAVGKPKDFKEALEKNPDWVPNELDGMYHGFSTNPNTGVWLKSHTPGKKVPGSTGWMEFKEFSLSGDKDWNAKRLSLIYDPDLQRMRYIEKNQKGAKFNPPPGWKPREEKPLPQLYSDTKSNAEKETNRKLLEGADAQKYAVDLQMTFNNFINGLLALNPNAMLYSRPTQTQRNEEVQAQNKSSRLENFARTTLPIITNVVLAEVIGKGMEKLLPYILKGIIKGEEFIKRESPIFFQTPNSMTRGIGAGDVGYKDLLQSEVVRANPKGRLESPHQLKKLMPKLKNAEFSSKEIEEIASNNLSEGTFNKLKNMEGPEKFTPIEGQISLKRKGYLNDWENYAAYKNTPHQNSFGEAFWYDSGGMPNYSNYPSDYFVRLNNKSLYKPYIPEPHLHPTTLSPIKLLDPNLQIFKTKTIPFINKKIGVRVSKTESIPITQRLQSMRNKLDNYIPLSIDKLIKPKLNAQIFNDTFKKLNRLDEGVESVVYKVNDDVFKFKKKLENISELKKELRQLNSTGSTPLHITGYYKSAEGDLLPVLKQPYVKGTRPEYTDIQLHMESKGWKPDQDVYRKGNNVMFDLHTGNAIKDPSGKLHIIDAHILNKHDFAKYQLGIPSFNIYKQGGLIKYKTTK